jgi:hypothetical protein
MALLLFFGGIFLDDSSFSGTSYRDYGHQGTLNISDCEYCIFYINGTTIGKQVKETENFPNVQLGSQTEFSTILTGNSFRLTANMFNANSKTIRVPLENPQDVKELLIYFTPNRLSGDQELMIFVNGKFLEQTTAKATQLPITLPLQTKNTSIYLTFALVKPAWYSLFNWNKLDVDDMKILAKTQDTTSNTKKFNFQAQKENLEKAYIDLLISCKDETKAIGEPIQVKVNGYILADTNPDCTISNKKITVDVPINILIEDKNLLEMTTTGYYKAAYSINKIYFNDKQTYTFNLNNFDDIIDLKMYGEFNPENLDMRINGKLFSISTDEMKSIIDYVKLGKNEIKILTKPVEIEELRIEKDEWR